MINILFWFSGLCNWVVRQMVSNVSEKPAVSIFKVQIYSEDESGKYIWNDPVNQSPNTYWGAWGSVVG
jgi:hypothetical protein